MIPSSPFVYRVEIERDGERFVWAIVAADLEDAARRATALASEPGARVVALQLIAPLL